MLTTATSVIFHILTWLLLSFSVQKGTPDPVGMLRAKRLFFVVTSHYKRVYYGVTSCPVNAQTATLSLFVTNITHKYNAHDFCRYDADLSVNWVCVTSLTGGKTMG